MGLAERLVMEWPVIVAAPYSFGLMVLAILVAAVLGAHLWNRREINATKAEKQAAEAATKLAEKQRDIYKDEAANYQNKLKETHTISGPQASFPVSFGNETVKSVYAAITQAQPTPGRLIFYGNEAQWSDPERARFAAAQRLKQEGLADFSTGTGGSTVVSGTSTAFEIQPYVQSKTEPKK